MKRYKLLLAKASLLALLLMDVATSFVSLQIVSRPFGLKDGMDPALQHGLRCRDALPFFWTRNSATKQWDLLGSPHEATQPKEFKLLFTSWSGIPR